MTVGVEMGSGAQGAPVMMDLEELLATRLLVQGNSGSGKSHLLRRLLEQSAPWVQQCIIDPEGDFVSLADKFGHVVVNASRTEAELVRIAGRVRRHRVSAILNLEGLDADQQMKAAAAFLNCMFDADREFWFPVLVVVDEAQLFAPSAAGEVSDEARRLSLAAMTNLMCRGRKRGLAGVIATQRLAKLAKNVAAEASNFLMGRTFLDIDMARAADLLGMDRRQAEQFRDLQRGSFIALGPALSRRPMAVTIGTVETAARSVSPRLMPLPQTTEKARDLIFQPASEAESAPMRRPVPPPPTPTEDILEQLSRPRSMLEESAQPPFPAVDEVEREQKLDVILREIADDPDLPFRVAAVLYQDFLVRCRIQRLPGGPLDLPEFKRRLAIARTGVSVDVAQTAAWRTALDLAKDLSDDIQPVFLIIALAAVEGRPCPSNAALARAYGSHSGNRARRLLTYFEERDLIVLQTDLTGQRIVAFPDLGCQTSPDQPDRPDEDIIPREAAE